MKKKLTKPAKPKPARVRRPKAIEYTGGFDAWWRNHGNFCCKVEATFMSEGWRRHYASYVYKTILRNIQRQLRIEQEQKGGKR